MTESVGPIPHLPHTDPVREEQLQAVTQDYVVQQLGKNHFQIHFRVNTRDGETFNRSITVEHLSRRDAIRHAVAIQEVARHIPTKTFRKLFESGREFKLYEDREKPGKYRIYIYNPHVEGKIKWQPLAVVNRWQNLKMPGNNNIYPARPKDKHTAWLFDSTKVPEGFHESFEPRGMQILSSFMLASMAAQMPGNIGGKLGVVTLDNVLDRITEASKELKKREGYDVQRHIAAWKSK